MTSSNPNAAAILALPAAKHPSMTRLAAMLAGKPNLSVQEASEVLDAACAGAGITGLDIEMCQPGGNVSVPFAVASNDGGASDYQAGVNAIIRARLQGGRRQ